MASQVVVPPSSPGPAFQDSADAKHSDAKDAAVSAEAQNSEDVAAAGPSQFGWDLPASSVPAEAEAEEPVDEDAHLIGAIGQILPADHVRFLLRFFV